MKSPRSQLPLFQDYYSKLLAVVFIILLYPAWLAAASEQSDYTPAPPFPDSLSWLNVSESLTIKQLAGRAVILDFWTYGCINCLHVADGLKRLEEKYGDRIVVIGIHSPKFDNEKNLATLRNIVLRYDRQHPIANDAEMKLMRTYGIRAWPTLLLIDPDGNVRGIAEGEGGVDDLDSYLEEMLPDYADAKTLAPLPLRPEKALRNTSILAAPGKISVSNGRIAISDTLHHRIILADSSGKIVQIFGGTDKGNKNGSATSARFNSPQGTAFSDQHLFVADTGNHLIRQINLKSGEVKTIAGTGRLGEYISRGVQPGIQADLRSPWDLAIHKEHLYIAMAGSHQISRLDLTDGKISPFAGSGDEGLDNGDRLQASFSQPSGLALIGDDIYVADAEASAIRRISLTEDEVSTIVGTGLFDFGDQDGDFEKAQLQHPLGITAIDANHLLITDTYNHKLKLLDTTGKRLSTLLGNGKPGREKAEGTPLILNEPGGLAMLDTLALIADTNNNRILFYNTETDESGEWPLVPIAAVKTRE